MKTAIYRTVSCIFLLLYACNSQSTTNHRKHNSHPFYIAADYLFWKADEDQPVFGIKLPDGFPPEGIVSANTILPQRQRSSSHSGFRALAGYYFRDHWDVRSTITHITIPTCVCVAGGQGVIVAPSLVGFFDEAIAGTAAQSNWCVGLTSIDGDIAQTCYAFKSLVPRFYLGFKWARVNQTLSNTYITPALLKANITTYNNFSGTGPHIGIDVPFHFWKYFNVVGSISTAFLYGKLNTKTQYNLLADTGVLDPVIIDCKKRLRPTLQCMIGLGFEKDFDRVALELAAGYEVQQFWAQWQGVPSGFALFGGQVSQGGLRFFGLVLRAGLKI